MLNLNSLNPQQRLAVETIHGPVLILAGAGTGKTRVITYRIAHLIDRGVPPEHILAVTFTNKAAREMKERVAKLIPRSRRGDDASKTSAPAISTFHSLGARILRQRIDRLGYKNNFVIYSESDQLGAVKKILSSISANGENTDPKLILGLLSRYKNAGENTGQFNDESARAMAEHIRSRYESALRACNAIDFDDLLLLTLKLLKAEPDVLAAYRQQFRYVMVDEYQDTNATQFRLVHLLTQEHRNLCVVGDDDQSIYGWRGAEISNLLDLEKYYREIKIIRLEQNYRSTNVILDAANALIKNNVRRRSKHLWSQQAAGTKITLQAFADDEAEARGIVEQIEFARLAQRIPWSQQAILFRTNQQSRPLEVALRQADVRYHLIGGQSYFDRREIKDALAYLKVFVNPHDDVSLLRVANVPARGLSEATMERLLAASHEQACSVYSAIKRNDVLSSFNPKARESVAGFGDLIEHAGKMLQSAVPLPLLRWVEQFFSDIGYLDEIRRQEKEPDAAENRIRNLKELLAGLDREDAACAAPVERLRAFLEELTLDNDLAEEGELHGDAVTLITMHSCKGLEFPHVYIVGLEDGLLPHARSKAEGTVDEERRLLYVAITRAMQTLTLSYCLGRKKYGQVMPCHPSPFLKELPTELVEHADAKGKQPVTVESGRNLFAGMRAALG